MYLSNSPNHFLASLSASDAALIEPHLKPLDLPRGTILYEAEDIIERVYFPHRGIISLVVGLSTGQYKDAEISLRFWRRRGSHDQDRAPSDPYRGVAYPP